MMKRRSRANISTKALYRPLGQRVGCTDLCSGWRPGARSPGGGCPAETVGTAPGAAVVTSNAAQGRGAGAGVDLKA